MNSEDKFLKEYKDRMDQTKLSDFQKQRLIEQLQQEPYRKKKSFHFLKPAFVLALGAAVITCIILPRSLRQNDSPVVHESLPLLPLKEPEISIGNGLGGLGTVGSFEYTKNKRASMLWPEKLPVYKYEESAKQRKLDPYDQDFMKETLASLMNSLQIDGSFYTEEADPYLMNSSVYAKTNWGEFSLMSRDYGSLFLNGSIPFNANNPEEALREMKSIIAQYPELFPIENPVIELRPVRKTAEDTRFSFVIYEDTGSEEGNLIASETDAILVLTDSFGMQNILYPLSTSEVAAEYPVLTPSEALDCLQLSKEYLKPDIDQIWLVWKADASGTWNIPYYRIYAENKNGGYESFDVWAIRPEYGQTTE